MFWHPIHMCYVWDQAVQQDFFSCGEISAFFAKKKKKFPVVILNSSLHYQIFEFDINIQILVWIIGSTYRKGEILKQK